MERMEQRQGFLSALPVGVLLAAIFVAPLLVVFLFSFMPARVFTLAHMPSFENYRYFVEQGYYLSLFRSLGMAAAATVLLFVVSYPLAYGMAKVFGKFTLVITVGVVVSLFVSENIRLFGWVLTLMKGGMLLGTLKAWTGLELESWLYDVPIIIFGLVYAYFPFMLFPLAQGIAMVPDEVRLAASDLGASRTRIFLEIDLPLAMPGIVVGGLLSFVLAAGAMAESKLLGGQQVIVMADEVETAFTYGQNWPLGSALSVILIAIIGGLAFFALRRIDLDRIMGRKA
ncbi:ABC transporter permease [Kaustia mangrovi]|uniref:ABC transporter permease n=1 Tax=Kaustia mangrovi TaxID=2593653 RepID=A0A7S8C374_9HYPH|nr:ABC transporter permease [Kaustia mangrovi]QPC42497.1 ABC transporter permease [Kaustia mangrovi]